MKTGSSERPDLPLALVVGAGGMGIAAARRIANRHRVILADLNPERVEERAAAMRDDGFDARGVACDILDPASVEALAGAVAATGPLRAIAHVAAKSPSMGEWRDIMQLNLVGAAMIERALLPLVGQGSAAVFISSMAAHLVRDPGGAALAVLDDPLRPDFLEALDGTVADRNSGAAYSLAKLGLNRMCARRAGAWGRRGARINSMSPGMIATPMGALEFTAANREAKLGLLQRSPVPREGTMVETSDAIEFLLSERASFITGTDLLVDGGVTASMRYPKPVEQDDKS